MERLFKLEKAIEILLGLKTEAIVLAFFSKY